MFPNHEDIKFAVLRHVDILDLKNVSLCSREWRERSLPLIYRATGVTFLLDDVANTKSKIKGLQKLNVARYVQRARVNVENIEKETVESSEGIYKEVASIFSPTLLDTFPQLQTLYFGTPVTTPTAKRLLESILPVSASDRLCHVDIGCRLKAGDDGQLNLAMGPYVAHVAHLCIQKAATTRGHLELLVGFSQLAHLYLIDVKCTSDDLGQIGPLTLPSLESLICRSTDVAEFEVTLYTYVKLVSRLHTPVLLTLDYAASFLKRFDPWMDIDEVEMDMTTIDRLLDSDVSTFIPITSPLLEWVHLYRLESEVAELRKPAKASKSGRAGTGTQA